MWRAFFFSVGIFAVLLGAECLIIDSAVLNREERPRGYIGTLNGGGDSRNVLIPDWAPWTFFAVGAITLIYTVTIPKRASGG